MLKGSCILVTGSTRGIGHAIAARLAADGARVGIHGRSAQSVDAACEQLQKQGAEVVGIPADLTEPGAAADLVSAFVTQAGQLDGLVNNAGGGKAVAFRGLTPERWRNTFRTNLEAAYEACSTAYTTMRKQHAGGIVNIASISAHGPGRWMGADYAASKAGLVSLTKSLAFEAARFGIRVNAISPGFIDTDMTAMLTDEKRSALGIPMNRLGRPQEVAAAARFLLTSDSAYMTGQVLHVNGGLWM